MAKRITATSVLGSEGLLFRQLEGEESLSQLYDYQVDVVAPSATLDLDRLLSTALCVAIDNTIATRYYHGIITDAEFIRRESATTKYYLYRLNLRPWLWYSTQRSDTRIFQDKSVVDIIQEVLSIYPFKLELRLNANYHRWKYCVQYDETDYDFISRLMQAEGIYFWFEHSADQHVLVLGDMEVAHKPIVGNPVVKFLPPDRLANSHEDYITEWLTRVQVSSSTISSIDFDFTRPSTKLETKSALKPQSPFELEVYQPLGNFIQLEDGDHYTRVRMESLAAQREIIQASSNQSCLACGHYFNLFNHPNANENKPYLITSVNSFIQESPSASDGGVTDAQQIVSMQINALDKSIPFRALQTAPIPKASGPQTAVVMGPPGEEIWTDQYGRIKVQFHWDRLGQHNDQSSCWIRVSSPWAGKGFGGVQIPRVNDEVVINFVGGYYDRPMIVGRVYNAANMPSVNLPADATQSGVKTRSKSGGPDNASSLFFEDKPGAEHLGMVAERNMDTKVNNNEDLSVAGKQTGWHGGTTKMDVEGTDDNICIDSSTEKNLSNAVRKIIGESNEIVTGPREHAITGNSTIKMQRGYVQNVSSGLADYTYGAGIKRIIDTDQTHTAESFVKREVTGNETVEIANEGYFHSVSGGYIKQDSSGYLNNTTTSDDMVYMAKRDIKMKAAGPIDVCAPCGHNYSTTNVKIAHDTSFQMTLLGDKSDLYSDSAKFVGISLKGINETGIIFKIAMTGAKVALTARSHEISEYKFGLTGVDLSLQAISKAKESIKVFISGFTKKG